MATEGELDGVTIIVPDFIEDLKIIGKQVVPMLAEFGVHANAHALAKSA